MNRAGTGWQAGFGRLRDSDLWYSFTRSPVTVGAALVTLLFFAAALLAPWIAPYDPFDPATLDLWDGLTPPLSRSPGGHFFLLGSDQQGRDMLSAILYGARISLTVGVAAVLLAMAIGVTVGLVSGFLGGWIDAVIMRIADVFLSFPTILIALLIDGVARALVPRQLGQPLAVAVLILAIGLSSWVSYARTVRGSTLVEKNKDYVLAARVTGIHPLAIMLRHVLPNVLGPVLVIATLGLAMAVITEATLSFLGVGVPPTRPSLGTLIRIGNQELFSGSWWITLFPGLALVLLALAVNLLGDWLRDALNPKLR